MKVVNTALAVLGLATAAVATTVAMAGEGGPGGKLKAADTNGDGQISRQEAAALPRLAGKFDAIDANKDGQLSKDEMHAARGGKGAGWKKLDTDGNGAVSKAEAQANAPRLAEKFDTLDANKDGSLSKEELAAGRPARK